MNEFEVWAWDSFEAVVRGVKFRELENAKKFADMCKLDDEITTINIDQNGNELFQTFRIKGKWQ